MTLFTSVFRRLRFGEFRSRSAVLRRQSSLDLKLNFNVLKFALFLHKVWEMPKNLGSEVGEFG
jgi:hypothetical protein